MVKNQRIPLTQYFNMIIKIVNICFIMQLQFFKFRKTKNLTVYAFKLIHIFKNMYIQIIASINLKQLVIVGVTICTYKNFILLNIPGTFFFYKFLLIFPNKDLRTHTIHIQI